jgi:hypothetical protein
LFGNLINLPAVPTRAGLLVVVPMGLCTFQPIVIRDHTAGMDNLGRQAFDRASERLPFAKRYEQRLRHSE